MTPESKAAALTEARLLLAKASDQATTGTDAMQLIAAAKDILARVGLTLADAHPSAGAQRKRGLTILLVDESGSMSPQQNTTIEAVNGAIDTLAKNEEVESFLTLMTFDSRAGQTAVRTICDAAPAKTATRLSFSNYRPLGGTPLYDAVAEAIRRGDAAKARDPSLIVTVMIQTDGGENESREFGGALGLSRLREMIATREAQGWQFIFMGAQLGEEAYTTAAGLGISRGATVSYAFDASLRAINMVANTSITRTLSNGAKVAYSAQQKAAVGDAVDGNA